MVKLELLPPSRHNAFSGIVILFMVERRDVLKFAIGGLAAPATAFGAMDRSAKAQQGQRLAQNQPAPVPPPPSFDQGDVAKMAQALAQQPFKAPSTPLPDAFASLTYDRYVEIKNKPNTAIWAGDRVGFALEPLHRGFIFSTPIQINLVENGAVRTLPYDPNLFDFGHLTPPPNLPDIGFSGFRVLQPRDDGSLIEVAIFQGASFFRALARGQNFGTFARGLSIRTADPRGEEFPIFRAVWIEQPTLASNALVIHALLDSDSIAGAYRFTMRPGDATIIDTECTLFPRTAIDRFGLATMTATSLLGPIDRRGADDVRPAVCELAGLQMLTGHGEWLWRPVSNRDTLQVSAFVDENPSGFGFLQRDRDFDHFQDDDQHWEMRPSLWIEPIGDWGKGNVTLVEIPSVSEMNQNVIAFWQPATPLDAGSETSFAYRQFWCWSPPSSPDFASVVDSRGGRPPGSAANSRRRRFLVEFTGKMFADTQNASDINPNLSTTPGTIVAVRAFLSRERKSFRVLFDVDPGSDAFCELRLLLQAQGNPISETWLYRWTA
jgi:periplasmic glucans biosynthesis protein